MAPSPEPVAKQPRIIPTPGIIPRDDVEVELDRIVSQWITGTDGCRHNASITAMGFMGKTEFLRAYAKKTRVEVSGRTQGANTRVQTSPLVCVYFDAQANGRRKRTMTSFLEMRMAFSEKGMKTPCLDYALKQYGRLTNDGAIESCIGLDLPSIADVPLDGFYAVLGLLAGNSHPLTFLVGATSGQAMGVLSALLNELRDLRDETLVEERVGRFLTLYMQRMSPLELEEIIHVFLLADVRIHSEQVCLIIDSAEYLNDRTPMSWGYGSPWADALAQSSCLFTVFSGRDMPASLRGPEEEWIGFNTITGDHAGQEGLIQKYCREYLDQHAVFTEGEAGGQKKRDIARLSASIEEFSGGVPGIARMVLTLLPSVGAERLLMIVSAGRGDAPAFAEENKLRKRLYARIVCVMTLGLSSVDRQALYKLCWLQSWSPQLIWKLMPEFASYPMAVSTIEDLPYVTQQSGVDGAMRETWEMHEEVRTCLRINCDAYTVGFLVRGLDEAVKNPDKKLGPDLLGVHTARALLKTRLLRDALGSL